jgi:hypothetical protein
MKAFFPGQPVWTMLTAAVVMTIAAVAMLGVDAKDAQPENNADSVAGIGAALTLNSGESN